MQQRTLRGRARIRDHQQRCHIHSGIAETNLIAFLNALLALAEARIVRGKQLISFALVSLHLSQGLSHLLGLYLSTLTQMALVLQLEAGHPELQLLGLQLQSNQEIC